MAFAESMLNCPYLRRAREPMLGVNPAMERLR
jgi:hypothetical protein